MKTLILLFCLPALCIADAAGGADDDALIVGPGEELRLSPPEAGARLLAAIDGGPLAPAGETLEAPDSGDHWLAVAARDRADNLSPIRWIRLRVDGTAPEIEIRTEPAPLGDRLWVPPGAEAVAAAEDGLAGVERLSLAVGNDLREVSEDSLRAGLPGVGEVTVRAWAIDRAGNRSPESTLELAIDAAPPTGEIRAAGPYVTSAGGPVLATSARIEVDLRDDDSGLASWTARIDGEEAPVEALAHPWSAGDHTVEAVALDVVGNQGTVGPFRFTVDAAGPEITWRVLSPGAESDGGETFYRPPVAVEARATDTLAGLEGLQASADGAAWHPLAGAVDVDGDALRLRATDRVGNVSDVRASWSIDRAPPEIRLETQDGEAVPADGRLLLERGDAVRPAAIDRGAGVESATYSVRVHSASIGRRWWWAPPRDQPLPEKLVLSWAGELTLSIEAVDRLGHRSTASWRLDVRRPKGGGS